MFEKNNNLLLYFYLNKDRFIRSIVEFAFGKIYNRLKYILYIFFWIDFFIDRSISRNCNSSFFNHIRKSLKKMRVNLVIS